MRGHAGAGAMVDDGGEGEVLDPPVDDLPELPVTPSRWWIAAAASILIALAFPYVWQAFAPVDGPRNGVHAFVRDRE